MADEVLTENDDDDKIELIPVDKPVEEPPADVADKPGDEPAGDDDGDDEEDDTRLAEDHSEDGDDADAAEKRRKRTERRERQRRARENAERELEFLRGRVAEFEQRFRGLEGQQLAAQDQGLRQAYDAKLREIRTAEEIMAKALEAGNGEDHVLAQRIRDQAINEANAIAQQGQQLAQQVQQVQNPGPDPRMISHAQEWLRANDWYDPNGGDEDSAITRAIDIAMTREGLDPSTRGYWEELTRRVQARFAEDTPAPASTPSSGRKRPPPQGTTRGEHAPSSTRKEIYVTPERKQAMIDAGFWDDPVKRNQMLKEYQQYDKANAARS